MELEKSLMVYGAISSNAPVIPNMASLVQFILKCCKDSETQVRETSAWVLSRYSTWICSQPSSQYLTAAITELAKLTMDSNTLVIIQSFESLETLQDAAKTKLIPYITQLVQTYAKALDTYAIEDARSMLYQAISSLVINVKSALNSPEHISALVPRIMEFWTNQRGDVDPSQIPELSVLQDLASHLGIGFQPYTETVFARCLRIVRHKYTKAADEDVIAQALLTISAIVEGLGSLSESFLQRDNFMGLVDKFLVSKNDRIKIDATELVGMISVAFFAFMKPRIPKLLPVLIGNLKELDLEICDITCWTLSEICIRVSKLSLSIQKLIFAGWTGTSAFDGTS